MTEVLNRAWYQKSSGHTVTDIQKRIRHAVHKWMAATLDGIVEQGGAVFEAKFMLQVSPKRRRPTNTWLSYSTTCGS